jgi:hypothetical protein
MPHVEVHKEITNPLLRSGGSEQFFLCEKNITHTEFQVALVRNMLAHAGQQPHVHRPPGRSANVVNKVNRLDTGSSKHWPVSSN